MIWGALDSFGVPRGYIIRGSARSAEECIGTPEFLLDGIIHAKRQSIVTRHHVVIRTSNTGITVGYAERGVWHEDPQWFDAHMEQLQHQEDNDAGTDT